MRGHPLAFGRPATPKREPRQLRPRLEKSGRRIPSTVLNPSVLLPRSPKSEGRATEGWCSAVSLRWFSGVPQCWPLAPHFPTLVLFESALFRLAWDTESRSKQIGSESLAPPGGGSSRHPSGSCPGNGRARRGAEPRPPHACLTLERGVSPG